jgi:hypothetical protein
MTYGGRLAWRTVSAAVVITTLAAGTARAQKLIVPGSKAIDGSRIRVGTEKYAVKGTMNGVSKEMGTLTQTASIITVNEKPALRVVQTVEGPIGRSDDTAIAMLKTLQPVSLRGYNEGGALLVDFRGVKITGQQRPSNGTPIPISGTFKQALFDSNMLDFIVAALPLSKGYQARLPVYVYEEGGELLFDVAVQGERIYDGIPCYDVVVTMPGGEMHYAMSKKDHTQIRAWFNGKSGLETTTTRITK